MSASGPTADEEPKRRSFLRDVVSVAQTRVAVFVLSFVSSVLTARLLGAEGKGLVVALTVVPSIIVTLSELGVRQATAYHIGRRTYPVDALIATLIPLILLSSALAMAIAIIVFELTWLPEYNWTLIALVIMIIPAKIAQSYASGVFLGAERIVHFNRVSWVPALTRLSFIVILVAGLQLGASGVIAADVIAALSMTAYAGYLLSKIAPIRIGFDAKIALELVRLGLIYAVSLFTITLLYRVNVVILQRLSTLEEIGVYNIGANIAEYIWQVPAVMGAIIFSRSANAKDTLEFTRKLLVLFRATFAVSVVLAVAIAIVGPFLIPMLYGPDFARSPAVLMSMLPGITAFIAIKTLAMDLAGKGKPWIMLTIVAPALVLNTGLAIWLVPQYGAIGAGVASSITYTLAGIAYTSLYAHVLKLRFADIVIYRKSDFLFLADRLPKSRLISRVRGLVGG